MGSWEDIGGLSGLDAVVFGLAGAALLALASASGLLRRIRDEQLREMDLMVGYDASLGAFPSDNQR
ncbi:MAG: hypothetical protein GC189_13215 [Alphaproteobacteria bacterium]|nr:hypothetical protein [Alphaproteobacteria bacterium]